MKRFNQIVFLSSFVMVGIFAMEEVVPVTLGASWVVEFDKSVVDRYAESNVSYYGRYKPDYRDNNIVSFPVESTDPLPIEYCGNKRFFVTSAVGGKRGDFGQALSICKSDIKQLAVVRGITQDNNRELNVYIGLDTDNVKAAGYKKRNRIYSARVMAMQLREKSKFSCGYFWCRDHKTDDVKYFGSVSIAAEVKNHIDKQFLGWNNPVFQECVKDLLGKRADDFDFERLCFYFRKDYWMHEKNEPKSITHYSTNK
ncbi:MAG TPA: hypothetical protein VKR54_01335 [Candidatus Babeliales bacterium]|jgi:hypothetical protein|nr:hypothetical protein [Candidatus Babeliales bacterium]